jgi:NDP-sugar pyrophosphorylase family protein
MFAITMRSPIKHFYAAGFVHKERPELTSRSRIYVRRLNEGFSFRDYLVQFLTYKVEPLYGITYYGPVWLNIGIVRQLLQLKRVFMNFDFAEICGNIQIVVNAGQHEDLPLLLGATRT